MSIFVQTAALHRFVYDEEQVKRFANFIFSQNGIHLLFINARRKYQTDDDKKAGATINRATILTKSFNSVTPDKYLNLVKSFEQPLGNMMRIYW